MSLRLTLILGGALAVVVLALGLYWKGRLDGAARARPKVEAALARAAVADLETDGARQSAQRIEEVVRQRDEASRIAADLTTQAVQAEDAHAPLEIHRAARLRAADRELCLTAELAGCPADRDAR
jgi:hypothetical protein